MDTWFLYFLIYSALGCGLERAYARFKRSPRQVRRCFLLLPLCPVYGLAMTALLSLAGEKGSFWTLIPLGAAVCTGVEYVVHLLYDKLLGVWFWDYRGLKGNVRGRVCPRFALYWGLLSALTVRWVHPWVVALAAATPWQATYALWLVFALDAVVSVRILLQTHDTALLSLPVLYQRIRPSNQSDVE
jgi:uncharacterized membrane protein